MADEITTNETGATSTNTGEGNQTSIDQTNLAEQLQSKTDEAKSEHGTESKRRRGRPPGSKNKPKDSSTDSQSLPGAGMVKPAVSAIPKTDRTVKTPDNIIQLPRPFDRKAAQAIANGATEVLSTIGANKIQSSCINAGFNEQTIEKFTEQAKLSPDGKTIISGGIVAVLEKYNMQTQWGPELTLGIGIGGWIVGILMISRDIKALGKKYGNQEQSGN